MEVCYCVALVSARHSLTPLTADNRSFPGELSPGGPLWQAWDSCLDFSERGLFNPEICFSNIELMFLDVSGEDFMTAFATIKTKDYLDIQQVYFHTTPTQTQTT